MRAWFALTTGDYRGVIAATRAGAETATHHGVAVQRAAQKASTLLTHVLPPAFRLTNRSI